MKRLYSYLPHNIYAIINGLPDEIKNGACELRLRRGGVLSLSSYTRNIVITSKGQVTNKVQDGYVCTSEDITSTVARLTEGSVYRYMPTINSGYIVTREGIRVGIAGECVRTSGNITSVTDFSAINIRIPHEIDQSGDTVLHYLCQHPRSSLLIYSPAGYGKTTVIRSVAKGLANGKFSSPQRVAVIDERGEILPDGATGLTDRFLGYSKPEGIEIAVRLFSPEYIVCDEIGLTDDTRAILSVQNCGVPFIATTHGNSLDEILLRPNIRELIEHQIFQGFARLDRVDGKSITVFEEREK